MDYYKSIKNILIDNEINKKVKDYSKNKIELQNYYNVGKLIVEAQGGEQRAKYGNKLIKDYSIKLTEELGKGYSETNLKYMRKFYLYQKSQRTVDLLPFNINYNCYIVIEMKVKEFKKEDVSQIKFYMNYIDKNIKSINHDKTIGIILCKKENQLVLEYTLDDRIYLREYKLV